MGEICGSYPCSLLGGWCRGDVVGRASACGIGVGSITAAASAPSAATPIVAIVIVIVVVVVAVAVAVATASTGANTLDNESRNRLEMRTVLHVMTGLITPVASKGEGHARQLNLGCYRSVPVSADKSGVGIIEGDLFLGDQLAAKGIICMECAEDGKEGNLIESILLGLVSGHDVDDSAVSIVDMAIEIDVSFSRSPVGTKELHPGFVAETRIERNVLGLDGLPKGPDTTMFVLGEELVVQLGSGPHDNAHRVLLRANPLLRPGHVSWRHWINQAATSILHASNDVNMTTWSEVGLDTELPLQVILLGEDRNVGIRARSVVVFSMGSVRRAKDGWARGLWARCGRAAHNLLD